MAKNKECEVCGESPAYKNLKGNLLCEKHFMIWVVTTIIVASSLTGVAFLIF